MNKKKSFALGLDISTSITGWSLLSLNDKEFTLGYLPLKSSKDLYGKADMVRNLLRDLNASYNIERVFVEQDLRRFRRGLSSAKTISKLTRFNGVVCQLAYEELKVKPVLINVNEARKTCGIKYNRKDKSKTTKEKVFEIIEKKIDYDWPKKVLKSGPRKGLEILHPGAYDAADAWVIATAGIKMYPDKSS